MNFSTYKNFIFKQLIQWLKINFSSNCLLCNEPTGRNLSLCSDCEHELPYLPNSCLYCAKLLPDKVTICGDCLKKTKRLFDNVFALFSYEFPIAKLILGLKFQQQLINAELLGQLMAGHLRNNFYSLPECIIPIPLHLNRLKTRGYNQALEIARPIAKYLNIPIDAYSCVRKRDTKAQASIPAALRKKNIKNAFAISKPISYKHIAILDDVMTTGQTAAELARVLKQAGVEKISLWCCAKTI